MIHKCAVGGCPNQSDTIIHYTLPEETSRRRQWVQFMRRGGKGVDISLSSRICGSHFSEDSFSKLDLGFTTRLILNVNAVPTIYPGDFTEAKKQHDVSRVENGIRPVNGLGTTSPPAGETPKEETERPLESKLPANKTDPSVPQTLVQEPTREQQPFEFELPVQQEEEEEETQDSQFNIIKVEPQDVDPHSTHLEPINEDAADFDGAPPSITGLRRTQYEEFSEGPFYCVYCGKIYAKEMNLKRHELTHHLQGTAVPASELPKPYRCNQCGKDFTIKAFLRAHQKVHVTAESQMAFGCPKCDRRFRKKSSLQKHMQNHLERPNYPCPVCGEEFEMKGGLHNHVRSHPGERLTCKHCDQRFLKFDAYIKHVDKHTVVTEYHCAKCNIYMLTDRGFRLHKGLHARQDQKAEVQKSRELGLINVGGRPKKVIAPDATQSEAGTDAQSLPLAGTADGTDEDAALHDTTPSDDAEMEEEEEEEELEMDEKEEEEELENEEEEEEGTSPEDDSQEESSQDDRSAVEVTHTQP
ncbi:gastrula zinc finger protein XlCGF48.2-like [Engraulis encrasicolus]|uniref:gastrula zinc finger protein XlCGF48.2-like n=1 Tax=Engraulis encrasicolus TaxID=184585 RepID=UPI002FD43C63